MFPRARSYRARQENARPEPRAMNGPIPRLCGASRLVRILQPKAPVHRTELDNSPRQWHQSRERFSNRLGPMKLFLLKLFTWWNGQTFGTQLWTWRFGELVGEDEQGNRYFRTKGRKIDPSLGFERRWVIYNGYAEATRVPPSWHGWLHHTVDVAPTEETYTPREWEKPHQPNLTGTPAAYRPSGSTLASGRRPKATGDYQPWTPGN
jgi:NADH:ubiquinone oxidoreductase subunit